MYGWGAFYGGNEVAIDGLSVEPYLLDAIKLDGSFAQYLAAHPCKNKTEDGSCLGDGKDIVYTYDNFEVQTYADAAGETIKQIFFTAPGIKTRKGIEVGSPLSAVKEVYGEPEEANSFIYSTPDGTVQFILDDANTTVTEIDFFLM